jgi:hypothetical protein
MTRKSGKRNTTGGNSVLNGTAQLYLGCKALDCTVDELCDMPIRMIILGDDVYTITTQSIADKMLASKALSSIGWDVKKEVVPLHKGTFCSAVWMPSSIGTILTGLPARIMVRGFGSLKKIKKPHMQQAYANALAAGLLTENMHNPIIKPLLERIFVLTSDHASLKLREQRFLNKELLKNRSYRFNASDKVITTSPDVYDFILNRYDINRTELDSWSNYCANIPNYQCGLDHIVIDKCIEVDIEEIDDYQRNQTGLDTDYLITPFSEGN